MRELGLDLLNVSIGFSALGGRVPWGTQAFLAPLAERFANETGLPVATGWCIDDPQTAERVVADSATPPQHRRGQAPLKLLRLVRQGSPKRLRERDGMGGLTRRRRRLELARGTWPTLPCRHAQARALRRRQDDHQHKGVGYLNHDYGRL
ncbi:hypothetical protein G6F31_016774 [Rhizopus arrhizus]|nr:hypothetical protein G6F31_016774 [Rhizopus arrhizus]